VPISFTLGSGAPDEAVELQDLGWQPDPTPPARSSVEAVRTTAWLVARVWSTPAKLKAQRVVPGTIRTIFTADGSANLSVGGKRFDLNAGQFVMLSETEDLTIENNGLWARFEWILRSTMLRDSPRDCGTAITLPDGYQHLIGAITNTLVTAPQIGRGQGAGLLLETLTGTLAAAVATAAGLPTSMTRHQADQYYQAVQVIDARHRDPAFNVQSLCQALAVSMSTLHAVFQAAGTTPRRALEARRVRTAMTEISSRLSVRRGSLDALAKASGFSSAKQMRAAISRHDPDRLVESTPWGVGSARASNQVTSRNAPSRVAAPVASAKRDRSH
jgi:AraC-like DNA-binding protein